MKKVISIILVFIGCLLYAQDGPKIEFENETINYGDVVKGVDSGTREFVFTNTGNATLIIKDVKSSCGCTIPEWPKTPIEPGKSDKIVVKYNMNPGPISKTITVFTNATNKPSGIVPLRIKGNVSVKE